MTKLRLWQNSYCDKTQIVKKLKSWEKIKNSNVTKLRLCQNSRTQIITIQKLKLWQNLKNWNWEKTRNMTNLNLCKIYEKTGKGCCSKNILTPWQPMRSSLSSVLRFLRCFKWILVYKLWLLRKFPMMFTMLLNMFWRAEGVGYKWVQFGYLIFFLYLSLSNKKLT